MEARTLVVARREEAPRAAALELGKALERAVAEREWAFLALPGGSFVRPIYDELAMLQIAWPRVELYFSEERGVPVDHPASNYGRAVDGLLRNPRIGAHQVHRMEAERPDREAAAARYAEELPEAFDAMLFEPGLDGHLGALLAGSPAFDPAEQRPVLPLDVPLKPLRRMALAPGVIRAARELVVVALGRERAEVVRRVLRGDEPERELPSRLLARGLWILDPPAAAKLG